LNYLFSQPRGRGGAAADQEDEAPRRRPPPPTRRPSEAAGVTVDPFNTPEPPTTPSSEPEFTCVSEGFFPHAKSCKKYYWCLEAAGLGMVAHTFTCPTGLYFSTLTDGCDFRRNVDCGDKDDKEAQATTTTPSPNGSEDNSQESDDDVEDPKSLKELLAEIKSAGGVDAFEEKLKEEEVAKEEAEEKEKERRLSISSRTRNRLSKVLERKRNQLSATSNDNQQSNNAKEER
jgi:chitinase